MNLHQPAALWHFTCGHAAPLIRNTGLILPGALLFEGLVNRQKWERLTPEEQDAGREIRSFAWFTDIPPPAPRGPLGLTMHSLDCDRTAFAFEVEPSWDTGEMLWWMYARREHPNLLQLEAAPAAMPVHWFVSEKPVPVYREWDARRGVPNG
jgi:hypothetical protein